MPEDPHVREHERSEKAHQREHEAEEQARRLAVDGINRRLDELNQLRGEVVTDRTQYLTRVEYAARHEALTVRVDSVERMLDKAEGAVNTWRWIAGFLGIGGVTAIVWALTQGPR